eukprot:97341-Rhodomonas_salina.1
MSEAAAPAPSGAQPASATRRNQIKSPAHAVQFAQFVPGLSCLVFDSAAPHLSSSSALAPPLHCACSSPPSPAQICAHVIARHVLLT